MSVTSEDYALLVTDMMMFSGTTFRIASGQKFGDTADEVEIVGNTTAHAIVMDRKATI